MNRFTLTGNLGTDARIMTGKRHDGSEYDYALLNLAVSTPQGKNDPRTDWFSIAVFNPSLVELMKSYGTKGKKLLIEGDMIRYTEGEGDQRRDLTRFRCSFNSRIELLSSNGSNARQEAAAEPQQDTSREDYRDVPETEDIPF